jgi:hypothetical protein
MVGSPAMRLLIVLSVSLAVACGGETTPKRRPLSKQPVSVRGWIADIEGANKGDLVTPETESARLQGVFQATSVWVEDAGYVSGGVAEDGSFILLDVPPGEVTIMFTAPGAENARLELADIPGNADVLIPAVLLKPGGVTLLQPAGVVVRVPANVQELQKTERTATVAGNTVPVLEAPLSALVDRRDYPARGLRPVAIVK